jgi:hypothetical protein
VKKNFKPLAAFLMVTLFTNNAAFAAPGSYASGNFAGGNGTTDAGTLTANGELLQGTTGAMTTAADTAFIATLTNSKIVAGSMVFAQIKGYSGTQGTPTVLRVTTGTGTATIHLYNLDAADALDGTITIQVQIQQPDTNLVG